MTTSIPTPDLSHLCSEDYENVYEPAEDSFLLLDVLEMELETIKKTEPIFCVEIGGGSGIISTALRLQLPNSVFFVTDINPHACKASLSTAEKNGTNLQVINTRTMECVQERLRGIVDIVICNPPYVATKDEETGSRDIAAAWAGGCEGMEVTMEVIGLLDSVLSKTGVAYIVLEKCNNPTEAKKYVESIGFQFSTILERRAGIELLSVAKISRLWRDYNL